MKLSIIVPAYNVEKYIKKCLESILACPDRKFEVLVMDDGSLDQTFLIASRIALKDDRVKVFHQKNEGPSSARNHAIKKSSGRYLMFVDGDDWVSQEMVACILKEIEKEYDLISFNFDTYCGSAGNTNRVYRHKYSGLKSRYRTGEEFLKEALRKNHYFSWYVWAHVYKRQVLENGNIWFREGIKYEDIDFTYKAICQCQAVRVIDRNFIIYRQDNRNSITSRIDLKTEWDRIQVIDANRKVIHKMHISNELKKLLLNNMAYGYCASLISCACFCPKEQMQLIVKLESKKYILKDIHYGKPLIAAWCIRIFGIRVPAALLWMRFYIRKNIRKLWRAEIGGDSQI